LNTVYFDRFLMIIHINTIERDIIGFKNQGRWNYTKITTLNVDFSLQMSSQVQKLFQSPSVPTTYWEKPEQILPNCCSINNIYYFFQLLVYLNFTFHRNCWKISETSRPLWQIFRKRIHEKCTPSFQVLTNRDLLHYISSFMEFIR
jgi:hypothetical protein